MKRLKKKIQIVLLVLFMCALITVGYLLKVHYWNYDKPINEKEKIALEKKEQYQKDLKGTGNKSNIIDLRQGIAIIEIEHNGKDDYLFELKTNENQLIQTIAKGTGDIQRKITYESPKEEAYILNVTTNGDLRIKIR